MIVSFFQDLNSNNFEERLLELFGSDLGYSLETLSNAHFLVIIIAKGFGLPPKDIMKIIRSIMPDERVPARIYTMVRRIQHAKVIHWNAFKIIQLGDGSGYLFVHGASNQTVARVPIQEWKAALLALVFAN